MPINENETERHRRLETTVIDCWGGETRTTTMQADIAEWKGTKKKEQKTQQTARVNQFESKLVSSQITPSISWLK